MALHPMIVVKDGKMDASRKYRGKIGKVIKNYAKDLEEDLKNAIPDRVFITHSECDAKTVEGVRDYIASLGIFKEIIETRAGGVISSHCGLAHSECYLLQNNGVSYGKYFEAARKI